MYFVGEGVTQDYQKAYRWFANAATRADREAMFGLGKTCLVLNRDDEALKWLNAACAADFLPACFWLGWMRQHGRCGAPDFREAYGYFSRAYARGHLPSGRGAASMLMKGCRAWAGRLSGALLWMKVAGQVVVAAIRDRKSRRLMI
jgi:TPR repeat protein